MKYVRKAIALILAAVFIAALAIGLSVIFAVRNVNVFRISYASGEEQTVSSEFENAVTQIESRLSSLEGRAIIAVGEDDISSAVAESGYAEFVSYEKIYPCTINITVRERLEVFAVPAEDGSGYNLLDKNCSLITFSATNSNNLDDSPNVLIDGVPQADYPIVAAIADEMCARFSSVRAFAESFTVTSDPIEGQSLVIKLRCGVSMEIREYSSKAEEKAAALFEAFTGMPDYLKLGGNMYCLETDGGELRVVLPDGSVA